MTKPPEYNSWCGMKQRCLNPNNPAHKNYGGRGIIVCQRWLESFANFLMDMGPRPSAQHSIDRYPNNNGNYEPDNCRWAAKKEQQNNRRDSNPLPIFIRKRLAYAAKVGGVLRLDRPRRVLTECFSRTQPWRSMGISSRTWRRWRQRGIL